MVCASFSRLDGLSSVLLRLLVRPFVPTSVFYRQKVYTVVVYKILGRRYQRLIESLASSKSAVVALVAKHKTVVDAEAKEAATKAKEEAAKDVEHMDNASKDSGDKAASTEMQVAPPLPTEKKNVNPQNLDVGDSVKVNMKRKAEFDGRIGKILKTNASGAKVEFTEGAQAGKTHPFGFKNLVRHGLANASAASGMVGMPSASSAVGATSGTKQSGKSVEDKAKLAENMAKIFGKTEKDSDSDDAEP